MAPQTKCPKCGGKQQPGAVHATGRFAFRPANPRRAGDVSIRATACENCGYLELVADVKALAALFE
jgi:predicted nucleic-acid-binding Zn-ribbon protein